MRSVRNALILALRRRRRGTGKGVETALRQSGAGPSVGRRRGAGVDQKRRLALSIADTGAPGV